jgi:DNA polymerase-3 subunit epsilon
LETTGLSHVCNQIIETAAVVLDHEGEPVEDGYYSTLVNPLEPIPYLITDITKITSNDVADKPTFATVAQEFVRFIFQHVKDWEEKHNNT